LPTKETTMRLKRSLTIIVTAAALVGVGSAGAASGQAPRAVPRCTLGVLRVSHGPFDGSAGHFTYPIVFRNRGMAACRLAGYPGVSYVGAHGNLIGRASDRAAAPVHTIILAHNQAATAQFTETDPGVFSASVCAPTHAAGLRVYPPGSFTAAIVPLPQTVCGSTTLHQARIWPVVRLLTPACSAAQLHVALGPPNGALGTIYYAVVFINHSSSACTLRGYPGVSSVTGAAHHQVGHPAQRDPRHPVATVTLAPRTGAASAALGLIDVGAFPPASCQVVSATALRVFAPSLSTPFYLALAHQTCQQHSTSHVTAVVPGRHG
jgi:hypothetical protein